MQVLIVEPLKPPYVKEIGEGLESLHKFLLFSKFFLEDKPEKLNLKKLHFLF